ncbi:MAG: N-acetyltransferase [Roseovarius sp.]|jgi:GNAT superfamily N-acetyltransferase|nr:N-acetyltransferase [Roseovarius sp.]
MTQSAPPLSAAPDITVSEATSRADRAAFVDLPYRAYRDVAHWRAPLRFERKAQLEEKHNPGLARIDHALMLARRDGQVVGRIAAIVNRGHLELYNDATGHFGFFDTLTPDADIAGALMAAAEDWLRARGMSRIAGPFSFSINEESGLLVDGFDTPPMMMMPHGRPEYAAALEGLGFTKAMDLYAFLHEFDEAYHIPPTVKRWKDAFDRDSALSIRPLNMKTFKSDIRLVMEIFNDAWSQNWGFVPFSADQITVMAQELKPLLRSESLWIAMIDGEPAGFTFLFPDLNEIVDGLDGKILPFGWAQLLYRLNKSR